MSENPFMSASLQAAIDAMTAPVREALKGLAEQQMAGVNEAIEGLVPKFDFSALMPSLDLGSTYSEALRNATRNAHQYADEHPGVIESWEPASPDLPFLSGADRLVKPYLFMLFTTSLIWLYVARPGIFDAMGDSEFIITIAALFTQWSAKQLRR